MPNTQLNGGVISALQSIALDEKLTYAGAPKYDFHCLNFAGNRMQATTGIILAQVETPYNLPQGVHSVRHNDLLKRVTVKRTEQGEFALWQDEQLNGEPRAAHFDRVEEGEWPEHFDAAIPNKDVAFTLSREYLEKALDLMDCCGFDEVEFTPGDASTGEGGEAKNPVRLDGRCSYADRPASTVVIATVRYESEDDASA